MIGRTFIRWIINGIWLLPIGIMLYFNMFSVTALPILAVLVTTSVYGLVDLPVGAHVYSFWYSWYFV